MNLRGKIFETSDNELQFRVQGGFIRQVLALRVQVRYALPEADDPRRKFLLVQEAIRLTVNEPGHPLAQLAQLLLDAGQGWALRVGSGWSRRRYAAAHRSGWASKVRTSCQTARSSRSVRTWVF